MYSRNPLGWLSTVVLLCFADQECLFREANRALRNQDINVQGRLEIRANSLIISSTPYRGLGFEVKIYETLANS